MTAHVHNASRHHTDEADGAVPAVRSVGSTRPRWLLPALAGGLVVAVLVAYGVLSPSVVLYGGLFGGMLVMHVGGHGNHGGHGVGTTTETGDIHRPASGALFDQTGPGTGPDHALADGPSGSESDGHDEPGSHGCH